MLSFCIEAGLFASFRMRVLRFRLFLRNHPGGFFFLDRQNDRCRCDLFDDRLRFLFRSLGFSHHLFDLEQKATLSGFLFQSLVLFPENFVFEVRELRFEGLQRFL